MDAVVGTLVLCSVPDVAAALKGAHLGPDSPPASGFCNLMATIQTSAEVKRVLKPGGYYIFIEHVAAQGDKPLNLMSPLLGTPSILMHRSLLGIFRGDVPEVPAESSGSPAAVRRRWLPSLEGDGEEHIPGRLLRSSDERDLHRRPFHRQPPHLRICLQVIEESIICEQQSPSTDASSH